MQSERKAQRDTLAAKYRESADWLYIYSIYFNGTGEKQMTDNTACTHQNLTKHKDVLICCSATVLMRCLGSHLTGRALPSNQADTHILLSPGHISLHWCSCRPEHSPLHNILPHTLGEKGKETTDESYTEEINTEAFSLDIEVNRKRRVDKNVSS